MVHGMLRDGLLFLHLHRRVSWGDGGERGDRELCVPGATSYSKSVQLHLTSTQDSDRRPMGLLAPVDWDLSHQQPW
jgi:hypothetical protein